MCPIRYRTRLAGGPLLRIATIRRATDTFLFISHTTNELLFKFRCNIFIGVRIIKEASGTHCTISKLQNKYYQHRSPYKWHKTSTMWLQNYLTSLTVYIWINLHCPLKTRRLHSESNKNLLWQQTASFGIRNSLLQGNVSNVTPFFNIRTHTLSQRRNFAFDFKFTQARLECLFAS